MKTPAATYGTPQTLGNLKTGRDELVYPTQLGRMIGGNMGEPVYSEADYQRVRDPFRNPVIEAAPPPMPEQAPQGQDDEYVSALNNQFDAQGGELDAHFSRQETVVRQQFQGLLENLQGEYQIERKYLEQTPMDSEQREAKVRQLNLKYEKAIYKLKSEAEPHFAELKQMRDTARFKLESKRAEGLQRLQLVRELSDKKIITDPAAALQEQLQVLGLNIPAAHLRQPSREQQIGYLEGQIASLDRSLSGKFTMRKEKDSIFGKDGKLRKGVMYSPTGDARDAAELSDADRASADELFAERTRLENQKLSWFAERDVGPMQRGMATAGSVQRTPFSKGIADQLPKKTSQKMSNEETRTVNGVTYYRVGPDAWERLIDGQDIHDSRP